MIKLIRISRLRRAACLLTTACLIATVAACTSSSVADNSLALKGNEGLVGFELIVPYGGGTYQIKLDGFFGRMLRMDNVPTGESIYLYKLSKGRYCLKALYLPGSQYYVTPPWSRRPCFVVTPGELTYGGTLSGAGYMIDLDEFLKSLKRVYPKAYAKYVIGPKPIAQPVH